MISDVCAHKGPYYLRSHNSYVRRRIDTRSLSENGYLLCSPFTGLCYYVRPHNAPPQTDRNVQPVLHLNTLPLFRADRLLAP